MVYHDTKNRDDLIIENIPLVRSVVRRIDAGNSGYDQDDLVSIGVIGLMDAIEKYDITRKVPFEAYARIRIRGSIIDELRKSGPVSRNRMEKLNEYNDARKTLENENFRSPTEIEIMGQLNIGEKELSQIHETVHYLASISLETVLYTEEGNGTELIDILEDKNTIGPSDNYENKELSKVLVQTINKLDEREKILLNLYYVEELTMKEIAYILDISIPRVSQIHGQILLKLKDLITPYMEVS